MKKDHLYAYSGTGVVFLYSLFCSVLRNNVTVIGIMFQLTGKFYNS